MLLKILLLLIWFTGAPENVKPAKLYAADEEAIRYSGRVDLSDVKAPVLVGSASFVELSFSGDSCQVLLKKLNTEGEHNYVSLELDGKYIGRVRLENETMQPFSIVASVKVPVHNLKIYKATEAQNGHIAFGGVYAQKLHASAEAPTRTIEFIGNSITCGMGIDWKEIPCDTDVWYDQHNAYWAYGPQAARALHARFLLSSVSGIGIYRNWNSLEPVMPDVYENLYLDTDDKIRWDFTKFNPDLVSICLGTNDFSDGDGVHERLPFDSSRFVAEYIAFVENLYSKYPDTQICLLTSPMVSGEKGKVFLSCLEAVKDHFSQHLPEKKEIAIYNFESIVPNGCGYHPDKEDHQEMAGVLIPFYKEVMGW